MNGLDYSKAPFPWFGGKKDAAPHVWQALGDVAHYVEPFGGSLAVLLQRPHLANRTYYSETVNDADGLLCNLWRAIQSEPDATAEAASWPVSEVDLMARHLAILRWRDEAMSERLRADPLFCDPLIAGWWVWGQSSWIGSGWCSGRGPWTVDLDTGRVVRRPPGRVKSVMPQLTSGRGVNRPQLREPGMISDEPDPDWHPMTMPELRNWFCYLSARLRHVRILCGDWTRLVTNGASKTLAVRQGGVCGIFLDPPYSGDVRDSRMYSVDDHAVANQVRDWCHTHGDDPQYRIVLAGFDTEHGELEAECWRAIEWFKAGYLKGGMGNIGGADNHQQRRERLWLSPHCLGAPTTDESWLW